LVAMIGSWFAYVILGVVWGLAELLSNLVSKRVSCGGLILV